MARLPLPSPRPNMHPLRTADPARSTIRRLPHRRMRVTIDHEPLAGVTPAMLLWWFQHIGDPITYAGEEMSAYLEERKPEENAWAACACETSHQGQCCD